MKLSNKWIEYLASQPESGMGYQKAVVTLKEGSTHEDVCILNCSAVVSVGGNFGNCPFSNDQIEKIEVEDKYNGN